MSLYNRVVDCKDVVIHAVRWARVHDAHRPAASMMWRCVIAVLYAACRCTLIKCCAWDYTRLVCNARVDSVYETSMRGKKHKKNLHVSIVVRRNYIMYVALDCTPLRYSHHECVSNIVSVSQVYVCVREISSVKTVVGVLLRGCVQSRWRIAKAIGKMTVMQTVPFKFALFTLVFGHI